MRDVRNAQGILDSAKTGEMMTQLLGDMRLELVRMEQEYGAQRHAVSADAPQLRVLAARIESMRDQVRGLEAERLDDDQLQFGFEDLEADLAQAEAKLPSGAQKPVTSKSQDDGALHAIGETITEMLDHVPARLRVIRIRRPRYGCRACGTIHQAPAQNARSPKAWPLPLSWPTFWSPSTAITFRCTDRARSLRGMAWN